MSPGETSPINTGVSYDVYAEVDVLNGGAGDDYIFAGYGDFVNGGESSSFDGADGNDHLAAAAGNDVLNGGSGMDLIRGGAGDDQLTGGADADVFGIEDLGGTDRIADFVRGTDIIDLSHIDASSAAAGDQAFTFVGATAFTNVAGQLRTYVSNSVNYVAGDVNGDGTADFIINLGSVQVQASDFLL